MSELPVHILGICGTFMGGVAALARELGLSVSGSDQNVYPPMSTQLEALGIQLQRGYRAENLPTAAHTVIIGNALSRGNAEIEAILNRGLDYQSGPEWLAKAVLRGQRVLAVAGTHGKTTTTSLLAWLLEYGGESPGFLVGGIPRNFGVSARLSPSRSTQAQPFVIEADEYDTAFFDKRSKFVHYRPEIAILNNLEFDHADIFSDLAAIERQFHYFVRTVPGSGTVIVNADDANLTRVLAMGCYSKVIRCSLRDPAADYFAQPLNADASHFELFHQQRSLGQIRWQLIGLHNLNNALSAFAGAHVYGVSADRLLGGFASFLPPKRRLEHLADVGQISIFDDFAHHPTAIQTTLAGLRAKLGARRIHAVLEPRSNSMRSGAHARELAPALAGADRIWLLRRPELPWDAESVLAPLADRATILPSSEAILAQLGSELTNDDAVLFMSNGGFDSIQSRLIAELTDRHD